MMQMADLSTSALEEAGRMIGDGPVVMLNLLWFRSEPVYPEGFVGKKPNARSAYYEGYAQEFRGIAAELGVTVELVYAGTRLHGLLAEGGDDWDDVVMVHYDSFADLQRIVAHQRYADRADPHRQAAIANWRFIATAHL